MKSAKQNRRSSKAVTGQQTRRTAADMLTLIVDSNASMEMLCDPVRGFEKFSKLDTRDQNLARAIVLTALRNKTRIEAALKKCWNRKPPQRARLLIHTLEISAAQILFMDVPQSAAVNTAVSIIQNNKPTARFAGFTNAVLRTMIRDEEALLQATADEMPFPGWIKKKLASDFGKEKTREIGKAILLEPNLDLNSKAGFETLDNESIDLPGGMKRLNTKERVTDLPGFDKGDWWVQDIAAAQPVQLLGNVHGKKVADLCAAPGGKTMQLAALGADVTAVDISANRINRLEENLKRTCLSAEIVNADILQWEPDPDFDAVLLDAPCSATGTIRKHPDILWNLTQTDIDELATLQIALINKASGFLKLGGVLVYANCSLFKQEGENLLASNSFDKLRFDPIEKEELKGLEFCITGQHIFRSLPHYLPMIPTEKSGMDGFFAARFVKV